MPVVTPTPGPATRGFSITPSDATIFPHATNHIWVGGIGNLVVLLAGDTVPITLVAVPADTLLPLCAVKVMAATTATALVGLY
jgi:hypothetical protein